MKKTYKEFEYADDKQKELYKKFPSTHYLSNPTNVDHVLSWTTFFRRNLHRFASDYLGIKLHLYQTIILFLMGISNFIVIIASRSAAKSFIIALYGCCRCILYPGTWICIASATKGQSKLIVSEKIKKELMNMSPVLRAEIEVIKDNQNETIVVFRNGSSITVVACNQNARGHRSHVLLREESFHIDKEIDDSVLSPFQVIRQKPYMIDEPYCNMPELQEDPINIYISSSWLDNGHWMWDIVDTQFKEMIEGRASVVLAFDESVCLKHGIKTKSQLIQEKKKQDPLTWRLEFLNERVKENTSAFFSYTMLIKNQRLKQVFLPRLDEDVRERKKNKYQIPKLQNEVRLVSIDMAFVTNEKNDNSIFSCMRLTPESYAGAVNNIGYHRSVPFITSVQGGDTTAQALAIRRLYEDFEADYIVLDTRNGGISTLDMLQKPIYDENRGIEYPPLQCMNNEGFANRNDNNGKECIFAINASAKLNSDIAFSFRSALIDERIDLLVTYNIALEDILPNIEEYVNEEDLYRKSFYEAPFWETQSLVAEASSLMYEKSDQTGLVKIYEQRSARKDRYTSVSYGNYFADLLEKDLLDESNRQDVENLPFCVGSISF
mgnify:CR=1 FL=1